MVTADLALANTGSYTAPLSVSPYFNPLHPGHSTQSIIPDLPLQITLEGRIRSGWYAIQPITIYVEINEDGDCIMSDELFYIYGEGHTAKEAFDDYVTSLLDYYQLLLGRSNRNQQTRAQYYRIREYVRHQE